MTEPTPIDFAKTMLETDAPLPEPEKVRAVAQALLKAVEPPGPRNAGECPACGAMFHVAGENRYECPDCPMVADIPPRPKAKSLWPVKIGGFMLERLADNEHYRPHRYQFMQYTTNDCITRAEGNRLRRALIEDSSDSEAAKDFVALGQRLGIDWSAAAASAEAKGSPPWFKGQLGRILDLAGGSD